MKKGHKEIIELLKLKMSKVRLDVCAHVHRHLMCVLVCDVWYSGVLS